MQCLIKKIKISIYYNVFLLTKIAISLNERKFSKRLLKEHLNHPHSAWLHQKDQRKLLLETGKDTLKTTAKALDI